MEFKCVVCGHLFPGDHVYHWRESHGELMTGCPMCMGAFEETVSCKNCCGSVLEDELYGGMCRECLVESMTPANLLHYLMDNHLEWDFYTEHLFDEEEAVQWLRRGFFRKMEKEDRAGRRAAFLDKCLAFVCDDEAGLGDYAQWYAKTKRGGTA